MGTDAAVDEALGRSVLCMISQSPFMAAGLEGRGWKGENEMCVGDGHFPFAINFIRVHNR